jgi:hypothetical protein
MTPEKVTLKLSAPVCCDKCGMLLQRSRRGDCIAATSQPDGFVLFHGKARSKCERDGEIFEEPTIELMKLF